MAYVKKCVVKIIESDAYKKLEKELLYYHGESNLNNSIYVDMVSQYMNMYITKCLLEEDIKNRGAVIVYCNGGGQKGKKKNESMAEHRNTNSQMINLLTKMNIDPSCVGAGDDDM